MRRAFLASIMLAVQGYPARSVGGGKEARSRVREDKYAGGFPNHIDQGLRYVRENVLPQLQQQDGFKGMVAFACSEPELNISAKTHGTIQIRDAKMI